MRIDREQKNRDEKRLTNAFTFAILCVSKEAYKLKCMVPLHRTPQTDPKGEDEAE